MGYSLITLRLGEQLRQRRLNRRLTQAALASLAGITRQKVIAIEKGDLSVGGLPLREYWPPSTLNSMWCRQPFPLWTKSMEYSTDDCRAAGCNA